MRSPIPFQVSSATEAHLHSRRQENADIGVQEPDAEPAARDAATLVPGGRQ